MVKQKVSDQPGCSGCPLAAKFPDAGFVPVKWRDGNRLVVGEAAGEHEAEQGEPFVGKSGTLLQSLYRKAGVQWDTLTVVNTLSCRPPSNVYPDSIEARSYCTKEEGQQIIQHCIKNHLKPVLEGRSWSRVDLIGDKALRYVAGIPGGITNWRGMPIEIDTEKL